MEEGNRDMKIRSTAVMSTSALTWRSSCPGVVCRNSSELRPYGIYTIPEISIMGKMKAQLTDAKIPYEVGIAKYEKLAKGQILGDGIGLPKIPFDPGTLRVLGGARYRRECRRDCPHRAGSA
jgi:NAD(P) transhydrogenase